MNEFISFLLSECNVCQITTVASNDCKMHSFLFSWTYASFQPSTCFPASLILEEEVMCLSGNCLLAHLFPDLSFFFHFFDQMCGFSVHQESVNTPELKLWKVSFSQECIKLEAKLYIFMSPARDNHFSIGTSLFQYSLKI